MLPEVVLLDTNVFLCTLLEPERLKDSTQQLLEDNNTNVLLSTAVTWEISIKYALGKLQLPAAPQIYLPPLIQQYHYITLPIQHSHTLQVAAMPHHHRDPFDRLLIAQSILEGAPLLTLDQQLSVYTAEVIWA